MKRIIIKSKFFSCDVKMDCDNIEGFLKGVNKAWLRYKESGSSYMASEPWESLIKRMKNNEIPLSAFPNIELREKIQKDYLRVSIQPC